MFLGRTALGVGEQQIVIARRQVAGVFPGQVKAAVSQTVLDWPAIGIAGVTAMEELDAGMQMMQIPVEI